MSVVAHLCGLTKNELRTALVANPPALRAAVESARADGFALVEPDLPLGRLPLPKDVVDRAVLALVVSGQPRELLFVRGHKGGVMKVREAAVLDLVITLRELFMSETRLVTEAVEVLAARTEPMRGKELLRAARERCSASTTDTAELSKALVRAWNDGLILLAT